MPIYEYECPVCGRFELFLPLCAADVERFQHSECGQMMERIPSLVTMRPDVLWAGHNLENYGYVTSSSQLAQIQKDKHIVPVGDRSDREAMDKEANAAAKARDEKFAKQTRAFIEERLTGAGVLDSFGQIRPEAMEKLSDEELLNPEAQKRKKETITISNDTND